MKTNYKMMVTGEEKNEWKNKETDRHYSDNQHGIAGECSDGSYTEDFWKNPRFLLSWSDNIPRLPPAPILLII